MVWKAQGKKGAPYKVQLTLVIKVNDDPKACKVLLSITLLFCISAKPRMTCFRSNPKKNIYLTSSTGLQNNNPAKDPVQRRSTTPRDPQSHATLRQDCVRKQYLCKAPHLEAARRRIRIIIMIERMFVFSAHPSPSLSGIN